MAASQVRCLASCTSSFLLGLGKRCTELGAIGQMRHLFRLKAHERSTSQPGVLSSLFDSDDECVLLSNPVSAVCNALLSTCQGALEGYFVHLNCPFWNMEHQRAQTVMAPWQYAQARSNDCAHGCRQTASWV